MKKIAVLTSGGDAPGMNAAIRAVVRASDDRKYEVFGIKSGFAGLIENDFVKLGPRDVGGVVQLGGTLLGSARCPEFKTDAGQLKALENLHRRGIDGLVVIGGNGSQTGSYALVQRSFPVVGIASTIDNDLAGSDITIGVDTALAVALEAIDRLKVTASSHRRAFLVEVMGRNCGYLALAAAIAGGAESVVIPEAEVTPEAVAKELSDAYKRGKPHALVVISEGARHRASDIARYVEANRHELGFGVRTTTLGHVQRGGAPGPFDRLLGSRFGLAAVDMLAENNPGVLVGLLGGVVTATPLAEVAGQSKPLDQELLRMAPILAR